MSALSEIDVCRVSEICTDRTNENYTQTEDKEVVKTDSTHIRKNTHHEDFRVARQKEKRLYDINEASEYLKFSVKSLYKMVWQKSLQFVVKVGRSVRFDKVGMDRWIETHTQEVIDT